MAQLQSAMTFPNHIPSYNPATLLHGSQRHLPVDIPAVHHDRYAEDAFRSRELALSRGPEMIPPKHLDDQRFAASRRVPFLCAKEEIIRQEQFEQSRLDPYFHANREYNRLMNDDRRDPFREKQRLSEDLEKQKRLLIEDLARDQTLRQNMHHTRPPVMYREDNRINASFATSRPVMSMPMEGPLIRQPISNLPHAMQPPFRHQLPVPPTAHAQVNPQQLAYSETARYTDETTRIGLVPNSMPVYGRELQSPNIANNNNSISVPDSRIEDNQAVSSKSSPFRKYDIVPRPMSNGKDANLDGSTDNDSKTAAHEKNTELVVEIARSTNISKVTSEEVYTPTHASTENCELVADANGSNNQSVEQSESDRKPGVESAQSPSSPEDDLVIDVTTDDKENFESENESKLHAKLTVHGHCEHSDYVDLLDSEQNKCVEIPENNSCKHAGVESRVTEKNSNIDKNTLIPTEGERSHCPNTEITSPAADSQKEESLHPLQQNSSFEHADGDGVDGGSSNKLQRRKQKARALVKKCEHKEDLMASQHRLALDLPRHNWLEERLRQEKKLNVETPSKDTPLTEVVKKLDEHLDSGDSLNKAMNNTYKNEDFPPDHDRGQQFVDDQRPEDEFNPITSNAESTNGTRDESNDSVFKNEPDFDNVTNISKEVDHFETGSPSTTEQPPLQDIDSSSNTLLGSNVDVSVSDKVLPAIAASQPNSYAPTSPTTPISIGASAHDITAQNSTATENCSSPPVLINSHVPVTVAPMTDDKSIATSQDPESSHERNASGETISIVSSSLSTVTSVSASNSSHLEGEREITSKMEYQMEPNLESQVASLSTQSMPLSKSIDPYLRSFVPKTTARYSSRQPHIVSPNVNMGTYQRHMVDRRYDVPVHPSRIVEKEASSFMAPTSITARPDAIKRQPDVGVGIRYDPRRSVPVDSPAYRDYELKNKLLLAEKDAQLRQDFERRYFDAHGSVPERLQPTLHRHDSLSRGDSYMRRTELLVRPELHRAEFLQRKFDPTLPGHATPSNEVTYLSKMRESEIASSYRGVTQQLVPSNVIRTVEYPDLHSRSRPMHLPSTPPPPFAREALLHDQQKLLNTTGSLEKERYAALSRPDIDHRLIPPHHHPLDAERRIHAAGMDDRLHALSRQSIFSGPSAIALERQAAKDREIQLLEAARKQEHARLLSSSSDPGLASHLTLGQRACFGVGRVPAKYPPLPHETSPALAYRMHSDAMTAMNERVRTVEDLRALQMHAGMPSQKPYELPRSAAFPSQLSEKEQSLREAELRAQMHQRPESGQATRHIHDAFLEHTRRDINVLSGKGLISSNGLTPETGRHATPLEHMHMLAVARQNSQPDHPLLADSQKAAMEQERLSFKEHASTMGDRSGPPHGDRSGPLFFSHKIPRTRDGSLDFGRSKPVDYSFLEQQQHQLASRDRPPGIVERAPGISERAPGISDRPPSIAERTSSTGDAPSSLSTLKRTSSVPLSNASDIPPSKVPRVSPTQPARYISAELYKRLSAQDDGKHGSSKSSSEQGSKPGSDSSEKRYCKICNKEAQFLCSGCRNSWYCSQQCQLTEWRTHSKTCNKSAGNDQSNPSS